MSDVQGAPKFSEAFFADFRGDMVVAQGLIFAGLVFLWLVSIWREIPIRLNRSKLGAVGFIAAVVTGGLFSLASILDWDSEFFLLALSLGSGISLALLHPSVSVSLFCSLLFLRPWELIEQNDYFGLLPKLTFSICLGHACWQIARNRIAPFLYWNWTATFFLLFLLWTWITTFKSPDPAFAQSRFFETFFKSFFLFIVAINTLFTKNDLKIILRTLVLTLLAVGVVSLYQTQQLSETYREQGLRLLGIGAFSNSNDIAALMVWIFPFGMISFLKQSENRISRVVGFVLMLVSLLSILGAQSRGALLAVILSVGLYFAIRIKKPIIVAFFLAGSILAIPVLLQFSGRDSGDLEGSSSSRLTYITTGLMMGLRNPILGVGFEGYESNFEAYATEILHEWGHRTAHNSWILAFSETGIIGFSFFVLTVGSAFARAWRIRESDPEFIASMVGYFLAITFLSHTYLLYPYLLFALIIVAHRLRIEEKFA